MIVNLLFSIIIVYLLITISLEDLRTRLISDSKLIILALSGLIYSSINEFIIKGSISLRLMINHSYLSIIIFITLVFISLLCYKLLGVTSLGLGDIKLISISALWFGMKGVWPILTISFSLSSIYFLYKKIYTHVRPLYQYPFGPFICIGIFSTWIMTKI